RILKNESVVELSFARQKKRFLEVGFGLAGEPNDEICRNAHRRLNSPEFSHQTQKSFSSITAMHSLQHTIAATLNRQMSALHEFRQASVRFDQIIAVTLRMR